MAYEQKDNSGSIFQNDKKEKDSHPDGKGSAVIGGVEYWVSSWNKVSANGTRYRSLSFTPKDGQAPKAQKRPQAKPAPVKAGGGSSGFDDMDNDLPPF